MRELREGGVGKYDPLRDHLAARASDMDELTMSFAQIEELVGKLPRSARTHRAWWSNTSDARAETRAWRSAGWRVRSADQTTERVVFARNRADGTAADAGDVLIPLIAATSNDGALVPRASGLQGTTSSADAVSNRESRRAMIGDLAIALVTAAAAGASGIIGLTHLPWLALALLSAAAGGVGFTVSQAIVSRKAADTARRWWSISTLAILLLCVVAFAYHKALDPATYRPQAYQFVVDGNDSNFIPLYGEAGGPPQQLATGDAGQNGLIGGQSYNFNCWAIGRDGAEWLRYERSGQTWWAPRALLHLPTGESQPQIPHC
jgi:hypothetical protein